jgi:hypothetical protein
MYAVRKEGQRLFEVLACPVPSRCCCCANRTVATLCDQQERWRTAGELGVLETARSGNTTIFVTISGSFLTDGLVASFRSKWACEGVLLLVHTTEEEADQLRVNKTWTPLL